MADAVMKGNAPFAEFLVRVLGIVGGRIAERLAPPGLMVGFVFRSFVRHGMLHSHYLTLHFSVYVSHSSCCLQNSIKFFIVGSIGGTMSLGYLSL